MFDRVNILPQKCGEVSFYPRKANEMNVLQTSSQVSSSFSQALSALIHARSHPLGPSKRFAVYSRCVIVYNTLQCLRPQLETPLPALLVVQVSTAASTAYIRWPTKLWHIVNRWVSNYWFLWFRCFAYLHIKWHQFDANNGMTWSRNRSDGFQACRKHVLLNPILFLKSLAIETRNDCGDTNIYIILLYKRLR